MLGYYTIYQETTSGRTVLARKYLACSWDAAVEGYLVEHPEDELQPSGLLAVPFPDPETVQETKRILADAIDDESFHSYSLDKTEDRCECIARLVGTLMIDLPCQASLDR